MRRATSAATGVPTGIPTAVMGPMAVQDVVSTACTSATTWAGAAWAP